MFCKTLKGFSLCASLSQPAPILPGSFLTYKNKIEPGFQMHRLGRSVSVSVLASLYSRGSVSDILKTW